jgi:hypothetical protein
VTVVRPWLGLASTLHAVIFAWAAHTLPWRPAAPLALLLWALALLHAATAVCAFAGLASTRRLWRALSVASLGAALVLIGSIAVSAERMVAMFGRLGWNLSALLAVIGVLVLGMTLPLGLWGVSATRARAASGGLAERPQAEAEQHTPPPAAVGPRVPRRLAGRPWAYLVGGGTLLAVIVPLFTGRDSFPLSNYPMFSRPRGQPRLLSVVASSAGGLEWSLPSALVGSDEVLQTKVLIQRAVDGGPREMGRLCAGVASRLSPDVLANLDRAGVPAGAPGEPAAFVDIVSRRYDPVQYFVVGPNPIEEQRLYRCDIDPRRAKSKKARRPK